jgi:hypothetical protein
MNMMHDINVHGPRQLPSNKWNFYIVRATSDNMNKQKSRENLREHSEDPHYFTELYTVRTMAIKVQQGGHMCDLQVVMKADWTSDIGVWH